MNPAPENGILSRKSTRSVEDAVAHLVKLLEARGVKLFTIIDHSGEAQRAGLTMPPTKLLIFGNPAGGTPVMAASPSAALDLPLKILVWQDADAAVWTSWNDPAYLQQRHSIPQNLIANLSLVEKLLASDLR